jgi:hypothetical protein
MTFKNGFTFKKIYIGHWVTWTVIWKGILKDPTDTTYINRVEWITNQVKAKIKAVNIILRHVSHFPGNTWINLWKVWLLLFMLRGWDYISELWQWVSCSSPKGRELRWNDTDRGKQRHWEKNLSPCHFVHHKSHKDWPRPPWCETSN